MKKIWIVIILQMIKHLGNGQNLIPNWNFEQYDSCPSASAQFERVKDWVVFKNDPDYWNACNASYIAGVPNNCAGYQQASTGNAYAGIHTFSGNTLTPGGYKEYIGVELLSPLVVGIKYFVSFKVSPTFLDSNCTTTCKTVNNKLGAFFSTVGYSYPSNQMPIPNSAQIFSDSIISDTANWSIIRGSFIADSSYKYVAIGNFFTDSATSSQIMNPSGTYDLAYYYIDDVCVSTDSLFCEALNGIDENDWEVEINLFPNPFKDQLTIELNKISSALINYCVYSLDGRKVSEGNLRSQKRLYVINLSTLYDGVYLLLLEWDKKRKKILILKN